ncbi:hypothetical protein X975_25685, partial [Stegodyphus mimosarum]
MEAEDTMVDTEVKALELVPHLLLQLELVQDNKDKTKELLLLPPPLLPLPPLLKAMEPEVDTDVELVLRALLLLELVLDNKDKIKGLLLLLPQPQARLLKAMGLEVDTEVVLALQALLLLEQDNKHEAMTSLPMPLP